MKTVLFALLVSIACLGAVERDLELLARCQLAPQEVYQDIWIKGQKRFQGVNLCDNRYNLIKPFLAEYSGSFSFIDIGAANGYFTFRTAEDFPLGFGVAVEHLNKSYNHHAELLEQLFNLNNLPNVTYLHEHLSVEFLQKLNTRAHFDVAFAFLVVHQINDDMQVRKAFIQELLKLSDRVIFEFSNDVAAPLLAYFYEFCKEIPTHDCMHIGTVERYYDASTPYNGRFPNARGEFFVLTRKDKQKSHTSFNFSGMEILYPHAKS